VNLSRWALRNPVTAGMVFVSIAVLGAVATPKLPLALLPEVDFPQVEVTIPYPNALPAQVEEEITRPAEEALATLSGVKRITSYSNTNQSVIAVQFDWGRDIGPLRAEAREKLDRIRDRLPDDVEHITVNSFRSSDIPVLECRISAGRDLSRDWDLLDRHVADPLRRVPGVAKVELYGVERPQILIDFRLDALTRHGVDADRVLQRVDAANRSASAGLLRRGDETWPLRVVNQLEDVEAFRRFPLGGGLTLGDLAEVRVSEPELDYGRHLNDGRAVGLNVIKDSGANTVAVAARARRVLDEIGRDPALAGIEVLTFTDQGDEIRYSLNGLLEAGLIGGLLSVGVLLFFLRNLLTTFVVSLAIPFSLLAACGLLWVAGRSLNVLSLMGLMLAVGMLVDNAVVVLESIHSHRERGESRLRAALTGSRVVLPAVVASTATSIIVFLPLVIGGRTEITTWIGEVGRTIIFTLLCSLFLSLTAIPLVLGRLLPGRGISPPAVVARLGAVHQRVLGWTLRHRPATLAIAFGVVASAVLPFAKLDKSTFTATRVEAVNVEYQFADDPSHDVAERYVTRVERWVLARKDSLHVKSTYSYFTNDYAFTRVYLAAGWAHDEGAATLRRAMRKGLPALPGARLLLRGDNEEDGESTIHVNLFGEPGPRLDQLADEAQRRLATVEGLVDVEVGGRRGRREVEVVVDRDRASRAGLSAADVGRAVALYFRGRPLARFRGPDGEVEVQARLAAADRDRLDRLATLPLESPGPAVPLAALAELRGTESPSGIERQQRRSVVGVGGHVDGARRGEVRQRVQRTMEAMHFPTGYSWSFGSGFEEENATQVEMLVNLLLALALVYLVMAGLFESLLHPFAIMLALPFAFVGIAWISFLTGSPFNLMAQIGLLILVGIVVNNGIVLLYHVHHLRRQGVERAAALLEASRVRLRPILMTTLTTTLGLLPLAIGQNRVADVLYYPLARTVIGGLAASTVLTLVLVPCLYTLLEDGTRLIARVWRAGPRAA
jgi:HAE1 family hydrophobic/amphiphilic exporter-1